MVLPGRPAAILWQRLDQIRPDDGLMTAAEKAPIRAI
jgi:hypothetical protein